jgi:hypothetical protein
VGVRRHRIERSLAIFFVAVSIVTAHPGASARTEPRAITTSTEFDELILFDAHTIPPQAKIDELFRYASTHHFDTSVAIEGLQRLSQDKRAAVGLLRGGIARHISYDGQDFRSSDLTGQRTTIVRCQEKRVIQADDRLKTFSSREFGLPDLIAMNLMRGIPVPRPAIFMLIRNGDATASGTRHGRSYDMEFAFHSPNTDNVSRYSFDFEREVALPTCPAPETPLLGIGLYGPQSTAVYLASYANGYGLTVDDRTSGAPGNLPTSVVFDAALFGYQGIIVRTNFRTGVLESTFGPPSDYVRLPDSVQR